MKRLVLPSQWRLVLGSAVLPAVFLLRGRVEGIAALALIWLASRLVGYRLWWRKLLPMVLGLILFYLLLPKGEVLWQLKLPWGGVFRLTGGALFEGVMTVVFLLQLLFLSGFSVGKDLRIPGRWGRQLARTLWVYQVLLQRSGELSFKRPFVSLDWLLRTVERELAESSVDGDVAGAEGEYQDVLLSCVVYSVVLLLPCWLLVLRRWW